MNDIFDYIKQILSAQPTVLASWGFSEPVPFPGGMLFHVEGFKHQGYVQIFLDEGDDSFIVVLLDEYLNGVNRFENVYLDQLVGLIDREVERTENYDEQVKEFLLSEIRG
jgi:hypothetical protein